MGCSFIAFLLFLAVRNPVAKQIPSRLKNVDKFLVPFISGQGLNNQLWQYRSAAIIARATNRSLCLEPFHRFYLQKNGRKFIPFEDLFDKQSLESFVTVASKEQCLQKCSKGVQKHLELTRKARTKIDKTEFFSIPDWRPGSLKLFLNSTGFEYLRSLENININSSKQVAAFSSLEGIRVELSKYSKNRCISVLGTVPPIPIEFLEWSRALKVSHNVRNAVKQIQKDIFHGEPYISIHWRFEESKCAGIGRGIGFGRSVSKSSIKINKRPYVRKSDSKADLCFYAGQLPRFLNKKGIWLRLVSRDAVVKWIKWFMEDRKIKNVYLATDCDEPGFLRWIKTRTGSRTKSDIKALLSQFVSIEDNDVVSRIEQQICSDSAIFLGTSMSSWTSSVIEERFQGRSSFFMQDKFNMLRRPDFSNNTLYFDIEVCDCDWKSITQI